MKKYSISFIALAAALTTLFSCAGDLEKDELPVASGDGEQELQASIPSFEAGDADTRLDMSIQGNSINLAWSEEDKIGVFPETGDQINFAMSKGAGGSTATFSGGGWALKNDAIYYAYYPFNRACYASEEMKNQVPCSFEGQVQTGENSLKHLGKYAYMYSSGSTPAEGKVTLKLQHLTTLLKLDLHSEDQYPATTIESITLEVPEDEKAFCLEGTIDLTKGTLTPTKTSSSITLACAGEIQLTTSGTSIYLVLPPTDLSGKQINVSVETKEFGLMSMVGFTPSQAWKAGHFYTKQLGILNFPVPFVTVISEVKEVGEDENLERYGVKYYDITYTASINRPISNLSFSYYFYIKDRCSWLSEICGHIETGIINESETRQYPTSFEAGGSKFSYTLERVCIPNSCPETRKIGGYTLTRTYTRDISVSVIVEFNDGQEPISSIPVYNQWAWFDIMVDVPYPYPELGEEL